MNRNKHTNVLDIQIENKTYTICYLSDFHSYATDESENLSIAFEAIDPKTGEVDLYTTAFLQADEYSNDLIIAAIMDDIRDGGAQEEWGCDPSLEVTSYENKHGE